MHKSITLRILPASRSKFSTRSRRSAVFLPGSLQEYLAYFRRPDLPSNLWKWTLEEDVKAVAGFSVVLKKSGRHRNF